MSSLVLVDEICVVDESKIAATNKPLQQGNSYRKQITGATKNFAVG
ncbi:hypothetical protein ACED63_10290 [Vibrio splendidus]